MDLEKILTKEQISYFTKIILKKNETLLGEGERISSLYYLKEGEIEKASQMLGRYYSVKGKVISGFHNGRIIGFPTMNLSLSSPYLLPKIGVYFSLTWVNGKPYRSITNVGNNPTVGLLNEVKIETHLLGFKEDAYGKEIEVQFLSFLREEITFSSLEDLALQLKEDQEKARKLPFPSLL